MKRFPHSRLSSISLCVALGLVTSACVKPDAPTVGMSKVEASLVFGVTAIPQAVVTPIEEVVALVLAEAPIAQQQQEIIRRDAPAPVEEEKPFEFARPPVPKFATPPASLKEACPEAPITAAPLLSPQPRVTGDPRPGTSAWRAGGFLTAKNFETGAPERQDFDGAGPPRAIRNLKKTSATQFSFEEVIVGRETILVTTYEVNNNPVTVNPTDGVGIVVAPGVGEPERGIVIAKIETFSKQTGQTLNKFDPAGSGLLLLPLPVLAGEEFTSTAVDARTGQVISHSATVMERQRVDACGELIDGWGVEYQRRTNFDGGVEGVPAFAAVEITYQTFFATQYGGVPIFDRFFLTADQCDAPCPLDFKTRVAQVNPDPLTP